MPSPWKSRSFAGIVFHLPSTSSTKDKPIDYRRPLHDIRQCRPLLLDATTKAPLDEGAFTAVYSFQSSHVYTFWQVIRRARARVRARFQFCRTNRNLSPCSESTFTQSVELCYNTSVDGSNLGPSVEHSHNTSAGRTLCMGPSQRWQSKAKDLPNSVVLRRRQCRGKEVHPRVSDVADSSFVYLSHIVE
jgi:hypothetical protein